MCLIVHVSPASQLFEGLGSASAAFKMCDAAMHCTQQTFEPERPMNMLQSLFSPPISPMPSLCNECRAMPHATEVLKKSRYLYSESSVQEGEENWKQTKSELPAKGNCCSLPFSPQLIFF